MSTVSALNWARLPSGQQSRDAGIEPASIDEVLMGNVVSAGEG